MAVLSFGELVRPAREKLKIGNRKKKMENPPQEIYGDFVTVARYAQPYQAYLIADSLEAEGIVTFIHGENVVSVYPFLVNDSNGIQLQVRASQVEAAIVIIQRIENSAIPSADDPKAIDVNGRIFESVNGNCPDCGQPSIYLLRGETSDAGNLHITTITMPDPMPVVHNYICYSCLYNWKG